MTSTLGNIIRPGITRGLDFVMLDELRKRTGVSPDSVLKFSMAEMLCNALDKDATDIMVELQLDGAFHYVAVKDNGSAKLSSQDLKLILDFENKASSKRGLLRVSRGYLGNALKCIFGYSYALAESKGLIPQSIRVKSAGFEYRINLKPHRVKAVIDSEVISAPCEADGFTSFTVMFPKAEYVNTSELKDLVYATAMVNLTRKIRYDILGERGELGQPKGGPDIRRETSVLWYTQRQFEALFEDFVRARPETQLKEFIPIFRGFTSKKIIGEILQGLSGGNDDCGNGASVQFFPATPIKDLPKAKVAKLFVNMKSKSKPISKRSIPQVLGVVGEEAFEKVREQNGWERLRYIMMSSFRMECPRYSGWHSEEPCGSEHHVEFPYLIEIAIFDRKQDDKDGLKAYQCVNFMSSTEDVFSRIFNIPYRLGRVGIKSESPVTVVAHLVSPVLKWLNYGKSGLDD